MGNAKSEEAVPALINSLKVDKEPLIRGTSAWALGQIGGEKARLALQDRLVQENDENVREEIHLALRQMNDTSHHR